MPGEKAPSTPRCGNCAAYVEVQQPPPNLGKQSLCCLFPPTPVAVHTPSGVQVIPMHAIVAPNLHCMQWREAESAPPSLKLVT